MDSERINQADSVAGLIKALAGTCTELRFLKGTVISEKPLKIKAENDDKLILQGVRLIIPEWLTDHKYPAYIETDGYETSPMTEVEDSTPFVHQTCATCGHKCPEHQYKKDWIIIKNHLKEGDKVIMLEAARSEVFLVIDREGDRDCRLLQ